MASATSSSSTSTSSSSDSAFHFLSRGKGAVTIWSINDSFKDPPSKVAELKEAKLAQWSPDGKYFMLANENLIEVYDGLAQKLVWSKEGAGFTAALFSPKSNYVLLVHRFNPDVKEPNLNVWPLDAQTSEPKFTASVKKFAVDEPCAAWTSDEEYFAYFTSGNIKFFDKYWSVMKNQNVGACSHFSWSKGVGKYHYAVVYRSVNKNNPGSVRIYSYPEATQTANRNIYQADSVSLYWNNAGTSLLALAQSEVDKTNKSYYGQTNMSIISSDGTFDNFVRLDKEGPIHDVAWSPDSEHFLVLYGYMPGKMTIFDRKCQVAAELGVAHRNHIRWAQNSKHVLVAGYGNLAGDTEIWEWKKAKKIGFGRMQYSSFSEMSPDGRAILTGSLSPKLRTDNCLKLWSWQCKQFFHEDFKELFQLAWRPRTPESAGFAFKEIPANAQIVSETKESPQAPAYKHPNFSGTAEVKENKAAPKAWVPPHQRGKEAEPKEKLPPGFNPIDAPKQKAKPKKAKKEAPAEPAPEPVKEDPEVEEATEALEGVQVSTGDPVKKIKALQKKLKQIQTLKEQYAGGAQLDSAQLAKLSSEQNIRDEIEKLRAAKK